MSDPAISVSAVDVMTAGTWGWDDSALTWRAGRYGPLSRLDPFPAYPHDIEVIRAAADLVAQRCPPRWDVGLYVLNREDISRTNGHSDLRLDGHYEGDTYVKDPIEGRIVLSAKRVQPHPAMSRYLVAHEYGHNVQWMIAGARGTKHPNNDQILVEYAEMRGLPTPIHFGTGGRWHDSAGEIFACDFRLAVCGVEPEFWPHSGVDRPGPAVRDWWEKALDELRAAEPVTAAT